jgi:hypothetical protein
MKGPKKFIVRGQQTTKPNFFLTLIIIIFFLRVQGGHDPHRVRPLFVIVYEVNIDTSFKKFK